MDQWEIECEREQAARVTEQAFHREVESFGIADGIARQAADPLYADQAAYLAGYCTGMALPAHAGATP